MFPSKNNRLLFLGLLNFISVNFWLEIAVRGSVKPLKTSVKSVLQVYAHHRLGQCASLCWGRYKTTLTHVNPW